MSAASFYTTGVIPAASTPRGTLAPGVGHARRCRDAGGAISPDPGLGDEEVRNVGGVIPAGRFVLCAEVGGEWYVHAMAGGVL